MRGLEDRAVQEIALTRFDLGEIEVREHLAHSRPVVQRRLAEDEPAPDEPEQED